jgi:hypothetical protein
MQARQVSMAFQKSESPIMDVFPYFMEKKKIWKTKKNLMHLKYLDLKFAADTMEFTVYEETAS